MIEWNPRIWAFGCSETFGHGLEDCYIKKDGFYAPGKEPSKFAYPQLIGDTVGKEVINLSRPGASNKHILQQIKLNQSEINKDDIVIIHWTYIERHAIFTCHIDERGISEGRKTGDKTFGSLNITSHWPDLYNIIPTDTEKIAKQYYKYIHSDSDAIIVIRWYMNYAHLTLKAQGVKSIHCPPLMNSQYNNNKSLINMKSWHEYDFLKDPNFESDISFVSKMLRHDDIQKDSAIDGRHSGPKTHRAFADLILKEFF